jgi:hypothetical protein
MGADNSSSLAEERSPVLGMGVSPCGEGSMSSLDGSFRILRSGLCDTGDGLPGCGVVRVCVRSSILGLMPGPPVEESAPVGRTSATRGGILNLDTTVMADCFLWGTCSIVCKPASHIVAYLGRYRDLGESGPFRSAQ